MRPNRRAPSSRDTPRHVSSSIHFLAMSPPEPPASFHLSTSTALFRTATDIAPKTRRRGEPRLSGAHLFRPELRSALGHRRTYSRVVEPLPRTRQGSRKTRSHRSRIIDTRIHSPHGAKALKSLLKSRDGLKKRPAFWLIRPLPAVRAFPSPRDLLRSPGRQGAWKGAPCRDRRSREA